MQIPLTSTRNNIIIVVCLVLTFSMTPAESNAQDIIEELPIEEATNPAPFEPENTLDRCRDSIDNDGDSHVDCDDQDCEIYAICVQRDEPTKSDDIPIETEEDEEEKKSNEIVHRPFSVSFAPGLTTDAGTEGEVQNNFSFNFIGWGYHLKGAEFSAIGGIRRGNVKGFQGAGIFNYTNGDLKGFQGAGIFNYANGKYKGFQAAGISNVTRGEFKGFQGAGISSVALDSFKGFQGAGIVGYTHGNFKGFQGAGITNYAHSVKGAQISGIINLAPGEVSGVQVGLINYASKVRGAQIGLINIATREMNGAPIGLINYAGDGILAPTLWYSDSSMINVGLKMGSRHVYGILGYGINPAGDDPRDSTITGLGGHFDFDPVWLEIDAVTHWLRDSYDWSHTDLDMLHKLRTTIGVRVANQLSLYAGPTVNLLLSDTRSEIGYIPTIADYSYDDWTIKLSIGFIAGLQWEPKWGNLNSR